MSIVDPKAAGALATQSNAIPSRTRLIQLVTEEISRCAKENDGMKLVGLNIQSLSPEAIELIERNLVERLSLQKNMLFSLPVYFKSLSNLRYLDLHRNNFYEFPQVLCSLRSLEILDISENKIRFFPANLGHLKNLKALSIRDNQFEFLPPSISEMENLKILEEANNPLILPGRGHLESLQAQSGDAWLDELKRFLSENSDLLEAKIHESMESTLDTDHSPAGVPVRSRSNSESFVSSRAAKRMGFVMKRAPVQEEFKVVEESQQPPQQPQPTSQAENQQQQYQQQELPHQPTQLQQPRSRARTHTLSKDHTNEELPEPQTKSSAYFRRLSTLAEVNKHDLIPKNELVSIARKILFVANELQINFTRFIGFCIDTKISTRLQALLLSSKPHVESIIECLELLENSSPNSANTIGQGIIVEKLVGSVVDTVRAVKSSVTIFQENLGSFLQSSDIAFIRMLYLSLFGVLNELLNACLVSHPKLKFQSPSSSSVVANNAAASKLKIQRTAAPPPLNLRVETSTSNLGPTDVGGDSRELYDTIQAAISSAQLVFQQINNAIGKSAIANATQSEHLNDTAVMKIKELTGFCISAMDITKKLSGKLAPFKYATDYTIVEDKKITEEINFFLKAIINMLASAKSSMEEELPILNEVRSSMGSLAKATKDLTRKIETAKTQQQVPTSSTMYSFPSATALTTPLLASLGAAAQAVMPNSSPMNLANLPSQNPFESEYKIQ